MLADLQRVIKSLEFQTDTHQKAAKTGVYQVFKELCF